MNLELHKSKNLLKILNTAIDAGKEIQKVYKNCLLYTSDAADE